MAHDEFDKPLGFSAGSTGTDQNHLGKKTETNWLFRLSAVLFLSLASLGVFLLFFDKNELGGEPFAIAPIIRRASVVGNAQTELPTQTPQKHDSLVDNVENTKIISQTAREIEEKSGVKVRRANEGRPTDALIIQIPEQIDMRLKPAPDKRLIEPSALGSLPKIGKDGAMPLEVYARPIDFTHKSSSQMPRIAILVGGLGLSKITTRESIDKLPAAVTLGFAPYGENLDKDVALARDAGHEIILQVPMQTYDLNSDGLGSHTLKVDNPKTLEDLHWFMGRFTGYVGIANFLGAKFMADHASFSLILHDIESRGLLFLMDSASQDDPSSDAPDSSRLAFSRVDVNIDDDRRPEAIERALARLESLARKNGLAVGSANSLPVSISEIARFSEELEKKGIELVPISATVNKQSKNIAEKP